MTHVMRCLDRSGDTETKWKPDDKASVAAAMARFNELIKQGHVAYRMEKNAKGESEGKVIKSFDKTAEEIIVHPQMHGG